MKTVAIVLVAGNSTRFESNISKQMFLLAGKPVFSYSIEAFNNYSSVDEICVVANENNINQIEEYIANKNYKKVHCVLGGATRQISVSNALNSFSKYSDDDFVIIHDGARPLIDEFIIKTTIDAVKKYEAVSTSIPNDDTLCIVSDDSVKEFPDRSKLARIQTPQAFKLGLIREAHCKAKDTKATDDCSLVMSLGHKVKLIPGSKRLTKLTTIEDAKFLEVLLK